MNHAISTATLCVLGVICGFVLIATGDGIHNQDLNTTNNVSFYTINATSIRVENLTAKNIWSENINATNYTGQTISTNYTNTNYLHVEGRAYLDKITVIDGYMYYMGVGELQMWKYLYPTAYKEARLQLSNITGDLQLGYVNNYSLYISENSTNGKDYPITLRGDTTINGTLHVNESITTNKNISQAGMTMNDTIGDLITLNAINASLNTYTIPFWNKKLENTILFFDGVSRITTEAVTGLDVEYYYNNAAGKNLNYTSRVSLNITMYDNTAEHRTTIYGSRKDNTGVHIFSRPNAIGSGKYGICLGLPSCVDAGYDFYTTNKVLFDGQVCFGDSQSCCDSSGSCTFSSTSSADMLITDGAIQACDGGCPTGASTTDGDIHIEGDLLIGNSNVAELQTSTNTLGLITSTNNQNGLGCWSTTNTNFNCTYTTGIRVSSTNYRKGINQLIIEHINNQSVNYNFKVNNKVVTQIDKGGNYYSTGNYTSYAFMYNYSETPYTILMPNVDIYYNITNLTGTYLNGFTIANSKLTVNGINHQGIYELSYGVSFSSASDNDNEVAIAVNGLRIKECTCHEKTGTSGDIANCDRTCIYNLKNGDIISLVIEDETAPANNMDIHQASLSLTKIAGD